ncbi:hypothetical protein FACS1894127_3500 [Clostridia bacterium]|nr:hypothetical protein FACS1894127_3500 [Clostridia bacterium]
MVVPNMEDVKKGVNANRSIREEDLQKIVDCVEAIEFGSVTLVIQNGHVLQIEKNEKIRLK